MFHVKQSDEERLGSGVRRDSVCIRDLPQLALYGSFGVQSARRFQYQRSNHGTLLFHVKHAAVFFYAARYDSVDWRVMFHVKHNVCCGVELGS